jgi:hypothetical protein
MKTVKNPGLLNRFEFQHGNSFQLLAQSLGCVRAPIAMLGESLSKFRVNRRKQWQGPLRQTTESATFLF